MTKLLHMMSGWEWLQDAFPDQGDAATWRISFVSGIMGNFPPTGVNFNRVLTLEVCPRGLRVKVTKLVGWFSQPFFVPWDQIEVRSRQVLFFRYHKLVFGRTEVGHLSIRSRVARKVSAASGGKLALPQG